MKDLIKPALTPEEWERVRSKPSHVTAASDQLWFAGYRLEGAPGIPSLSVVPQHEPVEAIALLNAMLSDDSPYKITRVDVVDEQQAYHDAVILARHYQDAGMETERMACVDRARRHFLRAAKLAVLLPPPEEPF